MNASDKNTKSETNKTVIDVKKQIIDEQMKEFWKYITHATDSYHKYNSEKAIPASVMDFSNKFFDDMSNVLNNI